MYRILSITLVGYRRMLLNEIRKITITPASAIQLILGTNGCGKSSLLAQLTPLPADKNDFVKGGSKVIEIESNGHHFVCSSVMNGKDMEHSFVMDGNVLNDESTATMQRDLCKKYFGVTEASHEMIRGVVKFTQLKPAERREWLISLCNANYDFAMDAYEQIKKRANWLTGANNINKRNLVAEVAKFMSAEEELKLEREVNELLAELQLLQAERAPINQASSHHLNARDQALRSLQDVSMRLLRNRVTVPLEYTDGRIERDEWGQPKKVFFRSLEEIDTEVDRLKHIVTGRQQTLVHLNEQYGKLQRQCEILTKTGAEGVESLTRKIQAARQQVTSKVERLRLGLVFTDARASFQALDTIELPFTSLLRELPVNSEADEEGKGRRYGRVRYDGMQQQMQVLTQAVNDRMERLHRLRAQKEHADLHRGENRHTCPRCEHSWLAGVNEAEYAKILETLKEDEKGLRLQETVRNSLQSDMANVEAYFTQYREVMAYTKSVGALRPFWEHLIASGTMTESPLEAVSLVQQVKRDLLVSIEIQELEETIDEWTKLRVQAEEVGDANLVEVRQQMEVLTERLGVVTAELGRVERAVAEYSEYRRQLQAGIQLGQEVERLHALVQKEQYEHVESFRRESILHCLRKVENALSLKQESLRIAKRQKELVELLRAQIAKTEVQEAAAKAMVVAISPKNGLIADGLLGFIRAFTGEMNTFINRFWRYPLQVVPTGYDVTSREQTSELDFKFPMVVERETNIIKDVSLGSEGIKEAVDLAWKMISIKYLGLSDTPLMLDEFGKCFDDEHRVAATEEVRWIMDNGNHPQLFMISHYAASYGAFTNAQMCVIDDRNVVIPSGRTYNEHVTITH